MAERRMFAKTIIDSDAFIDMSASARLLYYDLAMRADDDGFVNSPKKIMRMIGASESDLRLLAEKKFIIPFESGVVVIKHWKIHNYIRGDRYKPTVYEEEMAMLTLNKNEGYHLIADEEQVGLPNVIPMVDQVSDSWDTQVRLGKDRIGKDNITISKDIVCQTDVRRIVEKWNELSSVGIKPVSKLACSSKRYKCLVARMREYSADEILQAIDNIKVSDFLTGRNNKGWQITFDWFVLPSNFPKVLEGNYDNKSADKKGGGLGELEFGW